MSKTIYRTYVTDELTGKINEVVTTRIASGKHETKLYLDGWRGEALFTKLTEGDGLDAVEAHAELCAEAARQALPFP